MESEVAGAELLASRVEVEVEGVDGVDLGEAGVAESPVDGALDAALLLLVAEAVDDVGGRQVFLGRALEDRGDDLGHAGEPEPAELLHEQIKVVAAGVAVVVLLLHDGSWVEGGGSPGSRVMGMGESWS